MNEKNNLSLDDLFITLIPSNSRKADIYTIKKLTYLANLMGKIDLTLIVNKQGVSRARTELLTQLKQKLKELNVKHTGFVKALWFDDDIIMDLSTDMKLLVNSIIEADKNDYNLTANYKYPFDEQLRNVIFHKAEKGYTPYSDVELDVMQNLAELKDSVAGLGFYYGYTPLNYAFHDDRIGEDINFFEENNIDLRFLKIRLFHEKKVYI